MTDMDIGAIKTQVRSFVTGNFYVANPAALADDASLLDQGIIDSTGVLEVIGFLESSFGITVEAAEMVRIAKDRNLANCTFHNLRYYPQVQNMRRMREAGDLGEIYAVQGTYSQDWLLYDTDYNWRIEAWAGRSRAVADIGSHWFDTAEFVSGQRITAVCAGVKVPLRRRRVIRRSIASCGRTESKSTDATPSTMGISMLFFSAS